MKKTALYILTIMGIIKIGELAGYYGSEQVKKIKVRLKK